ncbi:MAG: acyltransferase family protein [Candidatus Lokiarchaeota archaeon]|nr:acyltransferase family protein [Candidatus Lokiarchaeota archaeon]
MASFVRFFNIWHMSLFFILAGMSTFYALQFRTSNEYIKETTLRLLIPLTFGNLLIFPPQVYIERISWWCETSTSRASSIKRRKEKFEMTSIIYLLESEEEMNFLLNSIFNKYLV